MPSPSLESSGLDGGCCYQSPTELLFFRRAVANRTLHARQLVREPLHLVRFQAAQEADQVVVDIEPMACSEVAHFLHHISIMLVARRGQTIVIPRPSSS